MNELRTNGHQPEEGAMRGRVADCIRAFRRSAAATMLSAATACAPAAVEPLQSYQGPLLPRPEVVLAADFAAGPPAGTPDPGPGARPPTPPPASAHLTPGAADTRHSARARPHPLGARGRQARLPLLPPHP